jgi:ComF family protein
LTFLGPPQCACCGRPFEIDPGGGARCGACLEHRPPFERARAVFLYDEASKGLVLGFKHADQTSSAPTFARWMARAGGELLADAELVVPVPLHLLRLFSRRYNQAALLANCLARQSGVPCRPDALKRLRYTPSQGTLGRRQRRDNVRGAFSPTMPLAGKRVLLVDDVFTTGATIGECTRALLDGGARAVDILTLARVVVAH